MKSLIIAIACVLTLTVSSGCHAMHHTVGNGSQSGETVSKRQWFAIWGLVPISDTDSKELAGGATDYSVKTEQSFLDIVINIFTGWITITSREMTVTK